MIQPAVYWDFWGLVNHLFAGPKITVTSDSCNHWSKRFHHQEGFFLGLNKAIISWRATLIGSHEFGFPFFFTNIGSRIHLTSRSGKRKLTHKVGTLGAWCFF